MTHHLPAQRLAKALGGKIDDERADMIHVGPHTIYASLTGVIKAARMGAPVHTLGHWSDPTDELAAAFRAWAGLRVAS